MTRSKRSAIFSVIIAIRLFALASPIIKLLVKDGGSLGLMNPGAISFCNVLFIGNFCAGIIVLLVFGARDVFGHLRRASVKGKILLFISSVLAFAYPALIFAALETTSVTNLVLLSRFEGIFYALMAWIIYKNAPQKRELLGYAIIGVGILLLVFLEKMFMFSKGDYLVLLGTILYAGAVYVSKESLKEVPLGAFLFTRNFFSALLFFALANFLYGPDHFAEAFEGELWLLMAIYSLFVVVIGQYMWFSGVKQVTGSTVIFLTMAMPVVTLFFAFLLLGEIPNSLQSVAIVVILMGMVVSKWKKKAAEDEHVLADKSLGGG